MADDRIKVTVKLSREVWARLRKQAVLQESTTSALTEAALLILLERMEKL